MRHPTRRTIIAGGLAAASVSQASTHRNAMQPPRPYGATPSLRQLAWHARERYAFVHFAMNTFTDKEWGYGDESPELFNPSDFSAAQIVAAAASGGLNGIILTAKHHDGFCIWPTMLTQHCIRNSPYRHGRGDIVEEMAVACRNAGMGFGLYLSPWDRNHAEYGRPAYLEYFRAQTVELCTRYGPLFEFWFDGANGGDGFYGGAREIRKIDAPAYYDWPSIVALVHHHQPMACTFDPLGADLRWVGNEDGVAGDPCWPTMPNHPYVQAEGNSGIRDAPLWWPAETDVSIRPGWFYHADEDAKVKSPNQLLQIYDQSVGRGTNLNLNLPPDRRGRIADGDRAVLKAFGDAIRDSFRTNLAVGAVASASHVRAPGFAAECVLDGRQDTYWSTPDAITTASLILHLPPDRSFDLIRVREFLPLGLRVTRFAFDAEIGGEWHELAEHECIGPQRIVRLAAPVTARRVRLRIVDAPACPAISEVALFRSVAAAAVVRPVSNDPSLIASRSWRIVSASASGAEALLDDDPATVWSTSAPSPARPVSITIDMMAQQVLGGFSLTPARAMVPGSAPPRGALVETSLDAVRWENAGQIEFPNIAYALATQRIGFGAPRAARYLRFTFVATALPADRLTIAGIGAFHPKQDRP